MGFGIPSGLRVADGAAAGNGMSCISTAALTDLTAGLVCVWAVTPNVSNSARNLVAKNVGAPGGWDFIRRGVDGTALRFTRYRSAGTACTIDSPTGTLKANVPFFVAAQFDIASSANCKMFFGTLDTPAALLTVTTSLGSGAGGTDAAQAVIIGNSTGGAQGWPGVIWSVGVSRQTNYSLEEIRRVQYAPLTLRNRVGLWIAGSTLDWSGNGATGTLMGSGKFTTEQLPRVQAA